jgi:hypothetical protein
MTSFIKSWKEMGVRKEPWEVCGLKNTFFTLEHKLGKKNHKKWERKGGRCGVLVVSSLSEFGNKKENKPPEGDFV